MGKKDWVWDAIIPCEPEGRHQYHVVNAHADQHREAIAKTATEG
ncbi:MAG: hypothetical protein M0Z36_02595 [Thermaerobacter sp.]|nr:hypothetical protein [Thermaerobacter sp.]